MHGVVASSSLEPRRHVPGRVSIIIPVWNGIDLSRACLDSLRALKRSSWLLCEVVVVDNGSKDGTRPWLEEQVQKTPWITAVFHEENQGFAGGCNAGLRVARSEYLMVLNNDTLVEPLLLEKLMRVWTRESRVGLVGPVSNYVVGKQLVKLAEGENENEIPKIVARLEEGASGVIDEQDFIAGLCMLGHRSFFEEVGLFDESYGIGNFEDNDLSLRARLAGRRLFIARDAYVHHFGTKTFEANNVDYTQQYTTQESIHQEKWKNEALFRIERLYAKELWDEVLVAGAELSPETAGYDWCLRCFSRAFEEIGKPSEAIAPWREFLNKHPLHTEGSLHFAFCLLEAGEEKEGRVQLARAFMDCFIDEVAGASALTRFARHCKKIGKDAEAMEYLDTAFQLVPDFLPGWNTKAVWLIEEERFCEVLEVLLPFKDDEHADVLANLGIAYFRIGRITEAVKAFEEGSRIGGPDSPAAKNLAQVMKSLQGSL